MKGRATCRSPLRYSPHPAAPICSALLWSTAARGAGQEPCRRCAPCSSRKTFWVNVPMQYQINCWSSLRKGLCPNVSLNLRCWHQFCPAILIMRSAAVCEAPAAAREYAEPLGVVPTCCGWSGRHSRAPSHNENCCTAVFRDWAECARSSPVARAGVLTFYLTLGGNLIIPNIHAHVQNPTLRVGIHPAG